MLGVIFFGTFVVLLLLGVFLFFKYKEPVDYLVVVPNSKVATKVRSRKYYKWIYNEDTSKISSLITPSTSIAMSDYTGKEWPATSGLTTGIAGKAGLTINIYNSGDDPLNLFGVTLSAVPKDENVKSKINMKHGSVENSKLSGYDGSKINLPVGANIQISNVDNYVLNRLLILCDNLTPRSFTVFIKNSSNMYQIIKIDNVTNDLVTIDLFKS